MQARGGFDGGGEAGKLQCQTAFLFFGENNREVVEFGIGEFFRVFVAHGGDAGVGVLEIGRGVAVHGQRFFPGEGDEALRVLAEVGVFDGTDADGAGNFFLLRFVHVGAGGFHHFQGAGFGFVEQGFEFDDVAFAGGEGGFGQAHETEPDVGEFGVDAELFADVEELLEVQLLAFVGDVDDFQGLELCGARDDGGDVGGGVVVAAVGFADNGDGEVVVLEVADERAVGLFGKPGLFEFFNGGCEVVVVKTFAAGQVEGDIEAFVDFVEFAEGEFDKRFPEFTVFGITFLEFDELGLGAVTPGVVGFGAVVAFDIDALELFGRGGLQCLLVGEFAVAEDDEAELGSPVAEMVVGDDVVAEGAVEAVDGVADDGGADVPDVHGFGDVGAGVVDDDGPAVSTVWKREGVVAAHGFDLCGEAFVFEEDVDEARTGDFNFLDEIGQGGVVDEGLTDGARVVFERLGELHGGFALVVAELLVFGGCDAEVNAGELSIGEAGGEGLRAPGRELFFDRLGLGIHRFFRQKQGG